MDRRAFLSPLFVLVAACTVQSDLPTGPAAYRALPAATSPVTSQGYLLGSIDVVNVAVFREPDLTLTEVRIDPAGNINMPLVGSIRAQGRTPAQLSQMIEQALLRYIRDPDVTVTVASIGQMVSVEGGVAQPGRYTIPGQATLIETLALAGSPTQFADNDKIIVFRNIDGRTVGARFDIERIRAGLDPDPVILPGDRVVVGLSGLKTAIRDYFDVPLFNVFRPF